MTGFSRSLFLPLRLLAVSATLVNRTIDDFFGDSITGAVPTYLPDSKWAQGNICSSCNINSKIVDVDRVHNGTWHDSTYYPTHSPSTITTSFTGQAVYVFNVIVNTIESATTFTNLTFYVDDAFAGDYAHIPDPSSSVMYDVPVFSATLHPGQHTLVISAEGSNESLVLFDYIIYTVDDEVRSQGTETSSLPGESTTASTGPSGPHSLSSSPTMFSTSAEFPRTPVTGARSSEPSGAPGSVTSTIAESTQPAIPEPSVSNPNEHSAKSPALAQSSLSSTSLGAISGGVAGAIVIAVVACWIVVRGRRRPILHSRMQSRSRKACSAEQTDILDLPPHGSRCFIPDEPRGLPSPARLRSISFRRLGRFHTGSNPRLVMPERVYYLASTSTFYVVSSASGPPFW